MSASRIHFLTARYPGVQRWLESGRDEGLWDVTVVNDAPETPPSAGPPRPEGDVVAVAGMWSGAYYNTVLDSLDEGLPLGLAWSSSPHESDTERTRAELSFLLACIGDGVATQRRAEETKRYWKPQFIACLHPAMAETLPGGVHLPAPIHVEAVPTATREDWVGFFVPPTEKKAIFSQLLAVKMFQRDHPNTRLVTNLKPYAPVITSLGIRAILCDWVDRGQLLALLSRCRVALHASLAESFGYGAVDAMMAGTPVVGSPALGWLPAEWRARDANDPLAVASVLEELWSGHTGDPRRYVRLVAERNNQAARAAVASILERVPLKAS